MKLRLEKRQNEVGEVESFIFSSPDLTDWIPGQYINITMPDVAPVFADRLFTITSAPHEKYIQITTYLGDSPFKQKLATLKVGDVIEADQLGGDFLYDIPAYILEDYPAEIKADVKRLFIAGGIGVTPYISIIRDHLHRNIPINATLVYAGKDHRRPFLSELEAATQKDPTLKLLHYNTERLTLEKLKNDIPNIQTYIVYLAGSQIFSETIGEGLVANGHPRNQIKYDYFDGYVDIEY